MRETMKNIGDLIDTFENTGDNGNFFIGDYSNVEIAIYIREQEKEIKRLREENLLLRASEPMSKLQEDYGYKARIDTAIKYIDIAIETIKRQPTENDEWILCRLYSIKNILQGSESNE